MQKNRSAFTVFFEDPFWVGVYERLSDGQLEVCRVVFGAQPKDSLVYEFLLKNWHTLPFGPPQQAVLLPEAEHNPKQARRRMRKQMRAAPGPSTKAQQALALQREEGKTARRAKRRSDKEDRKQLQYECRKRKRKEKHRGR